MTTRKITDYTEKEMLGIAASLDMLKDRYEHDPLIPEEYKHQRVSRITSQYELVFEMVRSLRRAQGEAVGVSNIKTCELVEELKITD